MTARLTAETPEPPPSAPEVAGTEAEIIIREILAVSAVVKHYLAAVTARNETDETRFTCGRKHPSMLWISATGARSPWWRSPRSVSNRPRSPL